MSDQVVATTNKDCHVQAIIFGVPGPVSYTQRQVVKLPNLPCWDVDALSDEIRHQPGPPMLLANDADLAVLGEHRFGAGRNVENLVFVSCGSGVGAGIILGGQLAIGRYSLGEIGHTIIDLRSRQTVEQLGSGTAIERSDNRVAGPAGQRDSICPADCESNPIIRVSAAFAVCVRCLALCFMPERIVVGGGCANAHPELLAAARDEISRIGDIQSLKPQDVVGTELGDDASIMGGYPFWVQATESDTSSSRKVS